MSYKYSLVVATYGRRQELELLLKSFVCQTLPASLFEVVIVDQNDTDLIDSLVEQYAKSLNLRHIKSNRKGLSYNRNLGISSSSGTYIAVPDDDCVYYADTLQYVESELQRLSYPDMVIGKVYDRAKQKHVFKKTPSRPLEINASNFYSVVSSISLFFKKGDHVFDENFGIGEQYHSNEDAELILHFLKDHKKVVYSPGIEINHPPYDVSNMSLDKLYKYGIGFGALCRKYASFQMFFLMLKVIVFQCLMLIKETVCLNFTQANRRWCALKGRLSGFFMFKAA